MAVGATATPLATEPIQFKYVQEVSMIRSEIRVENGHPILYLNEATATAVAYTTYFRERGCYEDFYRAGYRIFFVNLSFTTLNSQCLHHGASLRR